MFIYDLVSDHKFVLCYTESIIKLWDTQTHLFVFYNKKNAFCAICLSSRLDEAYYTQVSLLLFLFLENIYQR